MELCHEMGCDAFISECCGSWLMSGDAWGDEGDICDMSSSTLNRITIWISKNHLDILVNYDYDVNTKLIPSEELYVVKVRTYSSCFYI